MKRIVVFFIFWFFCSNLLAQIRIDGVFESTTLENQMSLFRDSTNHLTINDILKNKTNLPFILSKVASPSFGYDPTNRWVHFQVQNTSNTNQFVYMRIYRSYLDVANFYLCRENKIIDKMSFNWQTPYYDRQNQSRLPAAQFLLEPQKTYDIFILAKKEGVTWNFLIELYSKKAFFERENIEGYLYGLLTGGMILTVLMSLYLFSLSREFIYFYYSFYSLFSTLAVLSLAGYLNHYFGHKIRILTGAESHYFHLIGFVIFSILFTHLFFQIDKKGPKWLFILGGLIIIICVVYEVLLIFNYNFVYQIKLIYILLFFGCIIIVTLITALFRREVLAIFYSIAFLPLAILICVVLFSEMGFLKHYTFLTLLGPPSVLFEVSVLLLGLAYRLYDFQRQKQKLESEIVFQNLKAQETERNRIAQDLHDEVGNSLAALKNFVVNTNPELSNKINKIAQDVRDISHNLASIDFDKTTLSTAFQNLIHRQNEAKTIEYEFIEIGIVQSLSPDKSLVIYRIACELLNNIQKHSKAKKATVQLIYESETLTLMVEDDGVGIERKGNKSEGIGLNHIKTRVAYLNGKLTIDDDGKGTVVVINIPI